MNKFPTEEGGGWNVICTPTWNGAPETCIFSTHHVAKSSCMNIIHTYMDLGCFTSNYHVYYMHGLMPAFHAWNVHVSCLECAFFMHGMSILHAWNAHETGTFLACLYSGELALLSSCMCGGGRVWVWGIFQCRLLSRPKIFRGKWDPGKLDELATLAA